MSPQGLLVDPFGLAREASEISESRPVAGFERLVASLFEPSGTLDFSVRGRVDRDDKHWLELSVSGTLVVQCQRCLEALEWPLQVSNLLLLVKEGQVPPDDEMLEDDWDCLPAGGRLDLLALVEDEALLNLPFAPRHEGCSAPSRTDGGERTSPFAGLAQLRKPEGRG